MKVSKRFSKTAKSEY